MHKYYIVNLTQNEKVTLLRKGRFSAKDHKLIWHYIYDIFDNDKEGIQINIERVLVKVYEHGKEVLTYVGRFVCLNHFPYLIIFCNGRLIKQIRLY